MTALTLRRTNTLSSHKLHYPPPEMLKLLALNLQEVLPAMKLVKYYAWERFFEDKVAQIRSCERRLMIWNCVIKVVNVRKIMSFLSPDVSFCC